MSRKTPPQKIGSLVESLLAECGYLSACKEQEILVRWAEIAGSAVAAVTECTRAEDGVLYVRVLTSPWRQELTYLKPQLLDKIKRQCATITNIVFY